MVPLVDRISISVVLHTVAEERVYVVGSVEPTRLVACNTEEERWNGSTDGCVYCVNVAILLVDSLALAWLASILVVALSFSFVKCTRRLVRFRRYAHRIREVLRCAQVVMFEPCRGRLLVVYCCSLMLR
jgi:hypothetical protein